MEFKSQIIKMVCDGDFSAKSALGDKFREINTINDMLEIHELDLYFESIERVKQNELYWKKGEQQSDLGD